MGEARFFPDYDSEAEIRALLPIAKDVFEGLREKLPQGQQFGLLLLLPGEPMGRVVALTTDRRKLALGAAQWVLEVLRDKA